MVDLSKGEDRPVDSFDRWNLEKLEAVEETGNGQKTKGRRRSVQQSLSDYTGASIRVLEGIEAIRCALQCTSATPISMVCITW